MFLPEILKKSALTAAMLLIPLSCAFGEEAGASPAPKITAIEIRGLVRVHESAILDKITHRAGGTLVYENLAVDIKNIFSLGRFEDARVETEAFEDGLKLIYMLQETPIIYALDFRGNEEVTDDRLSEELGKPSAGPQPDISAAVTPSVYINAGSVLDMARVNQAREALEKLYQDKGFANASVVPVIHRMDGGRATLTFQIDEGREAQIYNIFFKGNDNLSNDVLIWEMETARHWFFSWLTGGGKYETENIEKDLEIIKTLYAERGYVNATVEWPKVEYTDEGKWIELTYTMKEGGQYWISGFSFSGNEVLTDGELSGAMNLKPGGVLNMKQLGADVQKLVDMYTERGYAVARVFPDIKFDEEKKYAHIEYIIREGGIYDMGRVEIEGNINTRDKVIRREMLLNEGDQFNGALLKRSYMRIMNTKLFDNVEMRPMPDTERKSVDIGIKVTERPTGSLNFSGGYSTVEKMIGAVDLTQGNLGGRGQTVKLHTSFSSVSTTYSVSFMDPWFMEMPVSFETSLYDTVYDYDAYRKKSKGFEFGFGRRFADFWSLGAGYKIEESEVTDIEAFASDYIRDQAGTSLTSSVSPYVSRDTRDNVLDPHEGTTLRLGTMYAGLGGDNYFLKYNLAGAWYVPTTEHTTFSLGLRHGRALGLYTHELPIFERYDVGGMYSVRGLGYGEAGPRDDKGNEIGGEQMVVFNAEFLFPIVPQAGLKGVFFYDQGAAYDRFDDMDLREGAGIGIRWMSPIGPIRLEWARTLDRRAGEDQSRWDFAFGTYF